MAERDDLWARKKICTSTSKPIEQADMEPMITATGKTTISQASAMKD